MSKQQKKTPSKTEANSERTQINLAKIALISAVSVALVGLIGTVLSSYFSSRAAIAPILIPIETTQTAEANTIQANAIQKAATASETPPVVQTSSPEDWTTIFELYSSKGTCTEPAVVPSSIDPEGDAANAWKQIVEADNSHDMQTWKSAPLSGDMISLTRNVVSKSDNKEWIQLSNTARITVHPRSGPPETHVNIVGECAGSGNFREFPSLKLESGFDKYELSTRYANSDFFTLQPGEFESFLFQFQCTAPGTYVLTVNIPYKYLGQSGTIAFTPPDLICPQSYTVWSFLNGYMDLIDKYTWDGAKYNKVP